MYGSIQDRRETGKWETDKKRQKGNQTLVERKVRIPVPEDPTHKKITEILGTPLLDGRAVGSRAGQWLASTAESG